VAHEPVRQALIADPAAIVTAEDGERRGGGRRLWPIGSAPPRRGALPIARAQGLCV